MAKSAIHKLLTEILHVIEKLIYIRFIDKHYIKNILLNSFHQQCILCQTTTNSHVRVRHPRKTCPFNSFRASVSTLNHHIFTYFVQRRSFLSSCYHLNLNQAFKVKNLVPMTMHQGRCHWTCALYQVLVRMLMQKRPLLQQISLNLCKSRNLYLIDFKTQR